MKSIKSYFLSKIDRILHKRLSALCSKSSANLVFRSTRGVDTIVHPQKLLDILRTNQSCDAEPWMEALDKELGDLEVVIDVGANIGVVSCWLAKRARVVHAFEPDEKNRYYLQKNKKLNLVENITAYPFAVGDSDGFINFYYRESFGHHGTTLKHVSSVVKALEVPSVTLDKFCSDKMIEIISLLKIDTEGSEINVLMGFDRYITAHKVAMILFEHAPVLFERHDQAAEVYDFLSERNYQIFDLNHTLVDRETIINARQGDFYAKPF